MDDLKAIHAMADKIEREKPWGCSVYRSPNGTVTISFGVPEKDLLPPILPMPTTGGAGE